jgi:D-alanyl-lipoteichoic acid acyltransferase DltB (MBOAT superfamily)
MSFLGIEFILFFILVTAVSYTLSPNSRCLLLLLASYFFYWTWQPAYLVILILSTLIDYFIALGIGQGSAASKKKRLLILGIIFNGGLLIFFKYFNFFNDFFRSLFAFVKLSFPVPSFNILLPLGISYYLLKKISYITDVYRGNLAPEKNFARLALYVSFFPEIVAGPIDRAASLLPQFLKKIKNNIDFNRLTEGLQMIGWGLFKKLIIADRLGILVNTVYDHPGEHQGAVIALATLCYSFQIYCDFSGYSDIAIGMGRVLGFKLMDNFKQPYLAKSITDFWKRWHISLSTWLRDYLFLPISYSLMRKIDTSRLKLLARNIKVEAWAYITGVLCTMLLCGLWHGADWTFVLWGLIHGLYLCISFSFKKIRKKVVKFFQLKKRRRLHRIFRISVTFLLVSFSWLFFRAGSVTDAFTLISRMFLLTVPVTLADAESVSIEESMIGGLTFANFCIAAAAIVFLLIVEFLQEKKSIYQLLADKPIWLRWGLYYFVIFSILLFGIYEQQEFIYGQF